MGKLTRFLQVLAEEPPFRLAAAAYVKRLSGNLRRQERWDTWSRPNYLTGVLRAADQAKIEGVPAISVFEFGVAGGNGLVALQEVAAAVERETGIRVSVFGFDLGHEQGLPAFSGDYRDHPDKWQTGDFPMNEPVLRARLTERTTLILGNVAETVPHFVETALVHPVGFVAIDVDLYSSARDALQIFTHPKRKMLLHVPMYFDDIQFFSSHKFAGELLAIDEVNRSNSGVVIDEWRGIHDRPFHERTWVRSMYVAHDLDAISKVDPTSSSATDRRVLTIDTPHFG